MKVNYLLQLLIVIGFQGKLIHGGHKTTLQSVKDCENPTPPKSKSDVVNGKFETYKKSDNTLLKGTMIVKKNVKLFLNFKAGVEENGKLKNYKLFYTKLTCKNLLLKLIMAAVNLKVNEDTCEVPMGNYQFEGFDINKIDHAMSLIPIREPGMNNWYLNFYGNDGTYICLILRVEIALVKRKPKH